MTIPYELHDQTIDDINLIDQQLRLHVECYDARIDDYVGLTVIFDGVKNLSMNGQSQSNVSKLYDEGEILRFKINELTAKILVQWGSFETKTATSALYQFTFTHLSYVPDQ